jgi:hypothetical protein
MRAADAATLSAAGGCGAAVAGEGRAASTASWSFMPYLISQMKSK